MLPHNSVRIDSALIENEQTINKKKDIMFVILIDIFDEVQFHQGRYHRKEEDPFFANET